MTEPDQPESDILPPEPSETPATPSTEPAGALSVPPPVPHKRPGFFRRLFMSRKKQQAVAIQNGYLEMVDLIRAIRSHLDRQETVQTSVLSMLEKVPAVMEHQHEAMTLFKQQLENGMENNRRLTDSMGNLNNTLASMDESQRASSRTVTDLITRSRESEQLLREVMRRSERRMTLLLVVFFLLIVALGFYFLHWQNRPAGVAPDTAAAVTADAVVEPEPAAKEPGNQLPDATGKTGEMTQEEEAAAAAKAEEQQKADELQPQKKDAAAQEKAEQAEQQEAPEVKAEEEREKAEKEAKAADKRKAREAKKKAKAAEKKARAAKQKAEQEAQEQTEKAAPATVGQPDLTLDQIKQAVGGTLPETQSPLPPADKPVSIP